MPKVGQGSSARNFPYNEQGMKAAQEYAQATGQQVDFSDQSSQNMGMNSNMSSSYMEKGGEIPMNDGAQRSVKTYAGGGMTGYNIMDKYEKGGKVDKYKSGSKVKKKRGLEVKDPEALSKAQDMHIQNKKDYEAGKIPKQVYEKRNKTLYNKIMLLTGQKDKVKLAKGGKVNKGITGVYGAVLDEGGYGSEVKKQKARLSAAEFREWFKKYKNSIEDKMMKKGTGKMAKRIKSKAKRKSK
tara:strand:+ start:17 stop:736 length:720 start_codon:yes stop_codon:yes gene_type:complete